MSYNDKYQKDLEKDLNRIYENYSNTSKTVNKSKSFDFSLLKKLREDFNNMAQITKDSKYPLIRYRIKDGRVFVNSDILRKFMSLKDDRIVHNLELIKKTLLWCKDNNLEIPNTSLYIWISDRFPYHTQNLNKFPIFVYSRPEDVDLPIFPDNTFYCLNLKEKYRGKCYDWDQVKTIISENCDEKKLAEKKEYIYFKGTDTTKSKHDIRQKLYKEMIRRTRKSNLPISIYLDAWKNYEPIYKFCNYKFLLNLPGHYPWSNRLKYLLLMNSIIINVNIELVNIEPNYIDKKYITFIDYIVDSKDYIDIIYKYYRCDWKCSSTELEKKLKDLNSNEFENFIQTLKDLYKDYKNNPNKYDKMINQTRKKIDKLNNERVYSYIYKCIKLNSKLIKN